MSDTLGAVQIGDESIVVTRFRGLKAMLAGALLARVMTEIPEINKSISNFRQEYREKNKLVLTKGMAKSAQFGYLGLEDSDFADGPIELPMEPSQQEILTEAFPAVWSLAREELTRFLALIAIKNDELERADDADQIEETLDSVGKNIMRKGTIDEILELCVVGQDVLKDQIVSKRDRLGKLLEQIPFLQTLLSTPETTGSTTVSDPQVTSPQESQTSSIISDEPMGGPDVQPSTESHGMSSSSSSQLTSDEAQPKDEPLKNQREDQMVPVEDYPRA